MYCPHCGKEIKDEARFCQFCGKGISNIPVENRSNPDSNRSKNRQSSGKGLWLGAIVGAAVMILLVSVLLITGVMAFPNGKSRSRTIEGKGFSSPEDALISYMNHFINQDVDGMMSCFAIETFVDNYDYVKYLEGNGGGMLYDGTVLPAFGKLSNDIIINKRVGHLSDKMYYQYLYFAAPKMFEENKLLVPFNMSDYDHDADRIIDELYDYTNDEKLKPLFEFDGARIDYETIVNPEKISKYMDRLMEWSGAEEFKPVAVVFEFDNESYVMCADAVRYDGRWYLYDFGGYVGAYTGIPTHQAGIEKLKNVSW